MNLVTTWAVNRIEDMSKELIRQSEHGTIKGVGKSSMGELKSTRIILGKEVNASSRCAAQLRLYQATKIAVENNGICAGSKYIIRLSGRSLCCRWREYGYDTHCNNRWLFFQLF